MVAPLGASGFESLRERLRDAGSELPETFRESQGAMLAVHDRLIESIDAMSKSVMEWHRSHEASLRLAEIPGVGPMTASYLTAMLDDGSAYRNARQFAASLGLVPRQHSTGGRQKLGGITKRGDPTLRSLLYEGAFALLCARLRDGGRNFPGTERRVREKSLRVVVVERAHRAARIAWSMIRHGTKYQEPDSFEQPSRGEN